MLMFYLIPPALIWLIVYKIRHPPEMPLPDGLIVLLIVIATSLIIAIAVFISNLDHLYI
jgi:hypothetical protein